MSCASKSVFVVTRQLEAIIQLPQFVISAPLVADGQQNRESAPYNRLLLRPTANLSTMSSAR